MVPCDVRGTFAKWVLSYPRLLPSSHHCPQQQLAVAPCAHHCSSTHPHPFLRCICPEACRHLDVACKVAVAAARLVFFSQSVYFVLSLCRLATARGLHVPGLLMLRLQLKFFLLHHSQPACHREPSGPHTTPHLSFTPHRLGRNCAPPIFWGCALCQGAHVPAEGGSRHMVSPHCCCPVCCQEFMQILEFRTLVIVGGLLWR